MRVLDYDGNVILHWTVEADEPQAKPKARITFSARLSEPPLDTTTFEVQTVAVE